MPPTAPTMTRLVTAGWTNTDFKPRPGSAPPTPPLIHVQVAPPLLDISSPPSWSAYKTVSFVALTAKSVTPPLAFPEDVQALASLMSVLPKTAPELVIAQQ